MKKMMVIINYLKKESNENSDFTFGFGEIENLEIPIEKGYYTMAALKNFFKELEEVYEDDMSVENNLRKLIEKEKINSFKFRDYIENIGGLLSPLPKNTDIYI